MAEIVVKKKKASDSLRELAKSRQLMLTDAEKPNTQTEKSDEFMRKKMTMMHADPKWHSHVEKVEVQVNAGLKFVAYINPPLRIQIYVYHLLDDKNPNSWYSVAQLDAVGELPVAFQKLQLLISELVDGLPGVRRKIHEYVAKNPYENPYKDVEAWLEKKK